MGWEIEEVPEPVQAPIPRSVLATMESESGGGYISYPSEQAWFLLKTLWDAYQEEESDTLHEKFLMESMTQIDPRWDEDGWEPINEGDFAGTVRVYEMPSAYFLRIGE